MSFFEKLKLKTARFFSGRYGNDQLNLALFALIVLLSLFRGLFRTEILALIYTVLFLALWGLILLRMLSKNIAKRSRENAKFLQWWAPMQQKLNGLFARLRDKEHRYYRCSCGTTLRVPKGKGKIKITCPNCGKKHIKKS